MISTSSPSNQRAIVWFRKDLRLSDHPALDAALQGGMEIIPVFVWDEERRRLVVPRSCITLVATLFPREPWFFYYQGGGKTLTCPGKCS